MVQAWKICSRLCYPPLSQTPQLNGSSLHSLFKFALPSEKQETIFKSSFCTTEDDKTSFHQCVYLIWKEKIIHGIKTFHFTQNMAETSISISIYITSDSKQSIKTTNVLWLYCAMCHLLWLLWTMLWLAEMLRLLVWLVNTWKKKKLVPVPGPITWLVYMKCYSDETVHEQKAL